MELWVARVWRPLRKHDVSPETPKPAHKHTALSPEHWRNRAEEARTVAERLSNPASRAAMESVAQIYADMAEAAEKRERARVWKKDGEG
jgi:hypothetical protein